MKIRVKNMVTEFYKNGDLIPVIGAGCSIPFGSPSWYNLIDEIAKDSISSAGILEAIEFSLKKNDYWEAIKDIKKFGRINEQDIQEEVADKIKKIKFNSSIDNNLKNLAEMDFNIYLTTNYDHFLKEYVVSDEVPICLPEIDFNSYRLYTNESKQIYHLHGHISNPGTIIISEESYNQLYEQEKYKNMFSLLGASKAFLFIGMSFDDQFMRALLKNHVSIFKSKSFILLDKSQSDKFDELKKNYNIEVIEYDSSSSNHILAIRDVLKEIANSKSFPTNSINLECEVIGPKLDDKRLETSEENLFYKKLKLENVDDSILELATLYFLAAEEYILSLRKNSVSKEILEKILYIVFATYKEEFVIEYKKNKCSESFVNKVHSVLKDVDFSRHMIDLESKQHITKLERQGLIHNLADDPIKGIWWGDHRIKAEK